MRVSGKSIHHRELPAYARESNRQWRHVDPSRPDLYPTVPFEEIMDSDKGVATWTKKIVHFTLIHHLPRYSNSLHGLLLVCGRVILCDWLPSNALCHSITARTDCLYPAHTLRGLLGFYFVKYSHRYRLHQPTFGSSHRHNISDSSLWTADVSSPFSYRGHRW